MLEFGQYILLTIVEVYYICHAELNPGIWSVCTSDYSDHHYRLSLITQCFLSVV